MGYSMSGNFGSEGYGADSSSSTTAIQSFADKVKALLNTQNVVDKKIAAMPGGAAKLRLIQQRDEARGVFSKYILPVYNKAKSVINEYSSAFAGDEDEAMGVIPLVAWGVIAAVSAASTAAAGYVYTAHQKEMKILNDPAFSAAQKTELLQASSIGGTVSQVKKAVYAVGIVAALWIAWSIYSKNRK